MKILGFLKDKQKRTNLIIWFLIAAIGIVVIWGFKHGSNPLHMNVSDNIQQIDLDTIYLKGSGVEVNFSDVILSDQNEMRKLIVSTQQGTVTTELTDRLIQKLDFDFLKKTQTVSYTGTGYFVVDLDNLTAANVIEDKEKKTITILIDHAYLQAIEIDPNNISCAFFLCLRKDTLLNPFSSQNIVAGSVPTFPTPFISLPDTTFSVGSLFCRH